MSRGHRIRGIFLCSLAVTALAVTIALPLAAALDLDRSRTFVYTRWAFVAVLLATPLLHQIAVRRGLGWRMPWVLATPATALLLTAEGIVYDIISAQV